MDNWQNREMKCKTCMNYVNFRCRRNAPTLKGFPAVYPDDWCGEHKISKDTMTDITIKKSKACCVSEKEVEK